MIPLFELRVVRCSSCEANYINVSPFDIGFKLYEHELEELFARDQVLEFTDSYLTIRRLGREEEDAAAQARDRLLDVSDHDLEQFSKLVCVGYIMHECFELFEALKVTG